MVGGSSFRGYFINHQHYRIAFAYVQTYVLHYVEKNLPTFWWFYLHRWVGKFLRAYSLFTPPQFLRWPQMVMYREKRG